MMDMMILEVFFNLNDSMIMNAQATLLLAAESQSEGTGTSEPPILPSWISQ